MKKEDVVRHELVKLLEGGNAHMTFEEAVKDFPINHINTKPPNVPYTPWHLLEHIRFSQWDILNFIVNPNYEEPQWPKDYWPLVDAKSDRIQWLKTIKSFQKDTQTLKGLVRNPKTDLYVPIPNGDGQTIFREILVVTDHNSYHIGEFAILRQVMETW